MLVYITVTSLLSYMSIGYCVRQAGAGIVLEKTLFGRLELEGNKK